MPRGRKKSHKGGHRHFTNEDDIQLEAEKLKKEQEWRKMKGIESDEEEEQEGDDKKTEDGATAAPVKKLPKEKPVVTGEPGELPPSDSEEGSEDDEDDEPDKPKGVSHLIEIENPNRLKAKPKKVSEIAVEEGAQGASLSRREREELEKQAAKERYDKMHAAGKTDEARADLARLALIRKQREEAAKKRDDEKKAQEDAKTAAEKKLMEKKKAAS